MINFSKIKLWMKWNFLNLGKFDVKSDMIIKTEESKKLGAKFLESADALSKVECLHLCCETENCDVFVYEEKVNIHIVFDKTFQTDMDFPKEKHSYHLRVISGSRRMFHVSLWTGSRLSLQVFKARKLYERNFFYWKEGSAFSNCAEKN